LIQVVAGCCGSGMSWASNCRASQGLRLSSCTIGGGTGGVAAGLPRVLWPSERQLDHRPRHPRHRQHLQGRPQHGPLPGPVTGQAQRPPDGQSIGPGPRHRHRSAVGADLLRLLPQPGARVGGPSTSTNSGWATPFVSSCCPLHRSIGSGRRSGPPQAHMDFPPAAGHRGWRPGLTVAVGRVGAAVPTRRAAGYWIGGADRPLCRNRRNSTTLDSSNRIDRIRRWPQPRRGSPGVAGWVGSVAVQEPGPDAGRQMSMARPGWP
jgi:hypothetical protein